MHKNECFEGFHELNGFLKNPAAVVYDVTDVRAAQGYMRILPFATSRQMIPLGRKEVAINSPHSFKSIRALKPGMQRKQTASRKLL